MARPLLYYITDRNQFPGDELARRVALVNKIAEAARSGVDYIQLREKDLSARELQEMGQEAVRVRGWPCPAGLLPAQDERTATAVSTKHKPLSTWSDEAYVSHALGRRR